MTDKTDSKEREALRNIGEEQAFEAWFKVHCPVDGANAKIAAKAAWKARASLAANVIPEGITRDDTVHGETYFTAADMATASAQGFRDGVASLAASAGSEPVAWVDERALSWLANSRSLSATITTKLEKGKSSERPMPLYTNPFPPEGMVGGWMPIETAPVAGLILLVVEDSAGERRVFSAEASHENGVWVWQVTLGWPGWTRLHSGWTPILWRRIPPPPTSFADSRKGE